jgi:hypothetical protein
MKKAIAILTIFFFALNFAQAQDVYFAGNGSGTGKIWKNNTLIHSISDTVLVNLSAMHIVSDSSILTAGYSHDTTYDHVQGRIWLNDSLVFDAGESTAINRLIINGNNWTAAGIGENEWENVVGLVWQNGEVLYAYSDSIHNNQINALAIDTLTGDLYSGGICAELESRAAIWKNDTLLWIEDSVSAIYGITFDGIYLYAAGNIYVEGLPIATLWQNDSIIFQLSDVAIESGFEAITLFDNSVYLAGYVDDSIYVWRDGEVLYAHPRTDYTEIKDLVVNEFGVYYAGQTDSVGTVWKDGEILYQPEDCDFVNALCVLPTPPPPTFTLTVEADSTGWGTVSGGGVYYLGDTATIVASPNIGCEFLYWNDSITDNPRDVVVLQDSTFIAYFGQLEYRIETVVTPAGTGSVTGGGTYHYGDTIELVATANIGFEFTDWTDGNTDNPRTIVVTGNATYIAHFDIQKCNITTEVTPEGAGTVDGQGVYNYGSTIRLIAHSNPGYTFAQWGDGAIENPLTILVEGDAHYIAEFDAIEYEITTLWNPEEGGTVSGGGIYHYGDTAVLTATPNPDFIFLCWSDGNASNPRSFIVNRNAEFTALFYANGPQTFNVTVMANDTLLGTVEGSGTYPEGALVPISATPYDNAYFKQWNDGVINNPRFIEITQDTTFTAWFVEKEVFYTITVLSDNPLMGSTYGSGEYKANSIINIGATPSLGFQFDAWQDGNTDNPRSIEVVADTTYTALFSIKPIQTYTITVYFDESQGFVMGAGTYEEGSTATLAAIPADDYEFIKWSDNNTENPRKIVVNQDIVLAAFFNTNDVNENGIAFSHPYPNPADDFIRIDGLEEGCEVSIFNTHGVLVKTLTISGDANIPIDDLATGLYLLRLGRQSFKFMKR